MQRNICLHSILVFSASAERRQRIADGCAHVCLSASIVAYSGLSDLAYALSSAGECTVLFDMQGMQDTAKPAIAILRNLNSLSKLVGVRADPDIPGLAAFFDQAITSVAELESGPWPGQTCRDPANGPCASQ